MASNRTYTDSEVLDIARRQKAILWLILISIPAYAASLVIPFLPLIVGIVSLVFIYQLAAALKLSAPWLSSLFWSSTRSQYPHSRLEVFASD